MLIATYAPDHLAATYPLVSPYALHSYCEIAHVLENYY